MPKKTSLFIREAVLEDARGIAAVHVNAWHESYQGIIDQSVLDSRTVEKRLHSRLELLNVSCKGHFVACVKDKVIGFCDAGISRSSEIKGEIYCLYVLEAYKGIGAGYQLFSAAISYLRTQGLSPIIAWILTENKPGQAFYKRQGGEICGTNSHVEAGKTYHQFCYLFT